MQPKKVRGVTQSEHQIQISDDLYVSLDDIHIFTQIAKLGSVRKAASVYGKNHNYLMRRLSILEHQTNSSLFHRTNKGMDLTRFGEHLLQNTEKFEKHSSDILGFIKRQRQSRKTSIVGVTEGLGTFWLVPRLVDFNETHPDILLDIRCQMLPADLKHFEADISIQLEPPKEGDAICSRIGYLHMMFFASTDYINKNGAPSTLSELPNFQMIEQKAPQVESSRLAETFPDSPLDFVSMRTNTSSSHAYAIARGAGIGVLPTYARAITQRLIPVCEEFHFKKEIYLSFLKESGEVPANKKVAKWLKDSFNPSKYPWFSESFVHPDQFESNIRSGNIVKMFDGFDQ